VRGRSAHTNTVHRSQSNESWHAKSSIEPLYRADTPLTYLPYMQVCGRERDRWAGGLNGGSARGQRRRQQAVGAGRDAPAARHGRRRLGGLRGCSGGRGAVLHRGGAGAQAAPFDPGWVQMRSNCTGPVPTVGKLCNLADEMLQPSPPYPKQRDMLHKPTQWTS
jgi:hypothetical protein